MKLYHIAKRFRIDKPDKFRLSEHDPAECYGLTVDKKEAKAMLAEGIERLSELQQRLYAEGRWSVLIVLQAMDAAGKDSIIKHVMSGINPQGSRCIPSSSRARRNCSTIFSGASAQRLPTNGRIGIFNRSHYEEVLTVRVHRNCWSVRSCRSSSSARTSGSSASRTSAPSSGISRATAR